MFQRFQSSAFWFQPVLGPSVYFRPEVIILHLGGSLSSSKLRVMYQIVTHVPPGGTRLKSHPAPLFSLHSLTPLNSHCLNVPFGTQGGSSRWKPSSYKQEMGDKERSLYLGWRGNHRILHSFNPSFSLILLHLEGWWRTSVLGGLGFTPALGGLSLVSTSVLPADCHFPKY